MSNVEIRVFEKHGLFYLTSNRGCWMRKVIPPLFFSLLMKLRHLKTDQTFAGRRIKEENVARYCEIVSLAANRQTEKEKID